MATQKNYPGGIDSFQTWIDDVDIISAAAVNDLGQQIVAIETELGTNPAGSMSDLKTRLAVSINDDGTLKQSAIGETGLQGIQGETGLQGPYGIQKKSIVIDSISGTYNFDFTNESLVDYSDTNYKISLTPIGVNSIYCWAVVSSAKSTTGFTISLRSAGTTYSGPYNASVNNVEVDVIITQ